MSLPSPSLRILLTLGAVAALAVAAALVLGLRGDDRRAPARTACVRALRTGDVAAFARLTDTPVRCAVLFNDNAATWAAWENPWFVRTDGDTNWAAWAAGDPARRLVISQRLVPTGLTGWRADGARGALTGHARTFATNLVAAGLGDVTIRLAWEANGTWYPDSVGETELDRRRWVAFWRATVVAMRAVPGARFRFDWTVNAAVRPLPLASFYPGDDVVDVVGIDAYDSFLFGTRGDARRWARIRDQPGGIADVLAFANAHGKPLSLPEWGVAPLGVDDSGGDNPVYVRGIAALVRDEDVDYQSYFFTGPYAQGLRQGPASLAAYRASFGGWTSRR